ncbi:MAG: carboxypeptidase-like regulatory domain-containing protein, partial [Bacteroidota bacterium]|nr:carboxypeptidase-like regulatory domain-containing protein [Bacteroidota bacterium]
MKKNLLHLLLIVMIIIPVTGFAQQYKIAGRVYDQSSNAPLGSANIVVQETQQGTISGEDGYFELLLNESNPVSITITYIGYRTIELVAQPGGKDLQIFMESISIMSEAVVVSASRVSEEIRKAPATVHKINAKEIQSATSGDYFQDLGNMRDVEIISNSMGFKIFNARGFNTTSPLRVVQYIDGVDNQLPTINIVPGNMFGASDLDIAGIEVISGPLSAMYGPNAMQGVLSYTTKDPYAYKGVSAKVKGGNREFVEAQFRYADAFFKNKLGIKLVGSYMSAKDWQTNNPQANFYGHQPSPPLNIDGFIDQMAQSDPESIFAQFQDYAEAYPDAYPGKKQFMLPGYMETELYDGYTNNTKVSASVHYRFNKNLEVKYMYRYSTGTSVYMGNNRAPLQNFYQQINLLELKGKQFVIKAYRSNDDTRNTYALNATGPLLGFAALPNAGGYYTGAYVASMSELTNGFSSAYQEQFGQTSNTVGMTAS